MTSKYDVYFTSCAGANWRFKDVNRELSQEDATPEDAVQLGKNQTAHARAESNRVLLITSTILSSAKLTVVFFTTRGISEITKSWRNNACAAAVIVASLVYDFNFNIHDADGKSKKYVCIILFFRHECVDNTSPINSVYFKYQQSSM